MVGWRRGVADPLSFVLHFLIRVIPVRAGVGAALELTQNFLVMLWVACNLVRGHAERPVLSPRVTNH